VAVSRCALRKGYRELRLKIIGEAPRITLTLKSVSLVSGSSICRFRYAQICSLVCERVDRGGTVQICPTQHQLRGNPSHRSALSILIKTLGLQCDRWLTKMWARSHTFNDGPR